MATTEPFFKKLIRCSQSNFNKLDPKNVIIIGNGAIESGWKPLKDAILEKDSYPFPLSRTELEQMANNTRFAAHLLANASYLFRSYRNPFVFDAVSKKKETIEILDPQKEYLDAFLKFRKVIAAKYMNNPEIKLRPIPEKIQNLLQDPKTAVITTNWDHLLWKQVKEFPNLLQLHGLAEFPDSLIFPTEATFDEQLANSLYLRALGEYLDEPKFPSRDSINKVWETYFRGIFYNELLISHNCASRWLESAETLILWGLSCHTYDAELNVVLSSANTESSKLKSLVVINPDPFASETIATLLRFPFSEAYVQIDL